MAHALGGFCKAYIHQDAASNWAHESLASHPLLCVSLMRNMASLLDRAKGGKLSVGLKSLGSDRGPGPPFPSAIRTVRPNAGNGPLSSRSSNPERSCCQRTSMPTRYREMRNGQMTTFAQVPTWLFFKNAPQNAVTLLLNHLSTSIPWRGSLAVHKLKH